MILSDLEETLSRQLGEVEARALAYEQALREIVERFDDPSIWTETVAAKMAWIAREALDKPEGKS